MHRTLRSRGSKAHPQQALTRRRRRSASMASKRPRCRRMRRRHRRPRSPTWISVRPARRRHLRHRRRSRTSTSVRLALLRLHHRLRKPRRCPISISLHHRLRRRPPRRRWKCRLSISMRLPRSTSILARCLLPLYRLQRRRRLHRSQHRNRRSWQTRHRSISRYRFPIRRVRSRRLLQPRRRQLRFRSLRSPTCRSPRSRSPCRPPVRS